MSEQNHLVITRIEQGNVTIHCCASPDDGERVNAQIIETTNALVVVDCMLMRPHASELRHYVDSLGKPIDRLFITHAHPDHWFGIEYFQDVDSYAYPETIEEIKGFAGLAIGFHRSQHGDLVIDAPILPNHIIESESIVVDGIMLKLHKVTAAEDLYMLVVELPSEKILIAQDLIYNKVHFFVGQRSPDGTMCFDGWATALRKFDHNAYDLVLPGHGVPCDHLIIKQNIEHLEDIRKIHSVSTRDNFMQNIINTFPDYELPSMVAMSVYFLYDM
ncbi:MBL fold metallo-hydrolase [Chlorobium sp. KB01]|uniref:MBL fold metallo-hydrolase n=1 Tax=Chlorobium sp. KB01 TaxID=1917528 RepID=UPI0009788D19|nr:MBL fold metallo-hydrolase [Chlorobium sp. KB01]